MRHERLTYTNARGESISFGATSDFQVDVAKTVLGLSDVRNQLYSLSGMGQDGATYIASRIESRDIEITGHIHTRDKERTHLLRRRLNSVLNPQEAATLLYEFGDYRRVITCHVHRAPVFNGQLPLLQFTLQLVALNPFWRDDAELRQDVAAWLGGLEFPLEIPVGSMWEIGRRESRLLVTVHNAGDVQTGMRVILRAQGSLRNPSLLNVHTGEFLRLNMPLQAGDVVEIRTGFGEKRITLHRAGAPTDAFRFLDPDSTFLQLAVGDNILRCDADENAALLSVEIRHHNLFLGV
ncbi:MAG: phage tail family protein [Oscillospiraceae bacterium]|nr:phage tail family protein [Oscillospiraceae bacterium]